MPAVCHVANVLAISTVSQIQATHLNGTDGPLQQGRLSDVSRIQVGSWSPALPDLRGE